MTPHHKCPDIFQAASQKLNTGRKLVVDSQTWHPKVQFLVYNPRNIGSPGVHVYTPTRFDVQVHDLTLRIGQRNFAPRIWPRIAGVVIGDCAVYIGGIQQVRSQLKDVRDSSVCELGSRVWRALSLVMLLCVRFGVE